MSPTTDHTQWTYYGGAWWTREAGRQWVPTTITDPRACAYGVPRAYPQSR